MREKLATFKKQKTVLLAVDPHEIWSTKYLLRETGLATDDLQFPLLMDPSQTVSATYGVAFQMRVHVEVSNRPATFLIDKAGIVRYARRGRSFADRPRAAQVLGELRDLK